MKTIDFTDIMIIVSKSQYQFSHLKWNCSGLDLRSPKTMAVFQLFFIFKRFNIHFHFDRRLRDGSH